MECSAVSSIPWTKKLTLKLKRVHLHFKERQKVYRMRKLIHLVILGVG